MAWMGTVADWWQHLPVSTKAHLWPHPRAAIDGAVLRDVTRAAARIPGDWAAVVTSGEQTHLTQEAATYVEMIDALTSTAQALSSWERRRSTDQIPPLNHLFVALTGLGTIVERLATDPGWRSVSARRDAEGRSLDEALDAYRWARSAPGGLREAARLYGIEAADSGVWQWDTWWFSADEVDPGYRACLAGRPAIDLVRRVHAAYVTATTEFAGVITAEPARR